MAKKRRKLTRATVSGGSNTTSVAKGNISLPEPFVLLGAGQFGDNPATVTAAGTGSVAFNHKGSGRVSSDPVGYHFHDGAELVASFDPQNVTYAAVDFEFTPGLQSDYAYPLVLSMRSESRMQISFNDRLCAVNGPAGSRLTHPIGSTSDAVAQRQRLLVAFDMRRDWLADGVVMSSAPDAPSEAKTDDAKPEETLAPATLSEIVLGRGGDMILHNLRIYFFAEKPELEPSELLRKLADVVPATE